MCSCLSGAQPAGNGLHRHSEGLGNLSLCPPGIIDCGADGGGHVSVVKHYFHSLRKVMRGKPSIVGEGLYFVNTF